MKQLIVMAFLIAQSLAHAASYTCQCQVQRNDGDIKSAVAVVEANSESSAKSISRTPCFNAAVRKFQLLSNFSDPTLVYHRCDVGAVYDVR